MADASIHFETAKPGNFGHMMREQNRKSATYLLKESKYENEYWTKSEDGRDVAQELFDQEYAKLSGRGKRPKYENCVQEAVINLNAGHTLEDVKAVCEKLEEKYGFVCTSIAIHRDEGHAEDNHTEYNLHAHAQFMTFTQVEGEKKPSAKWSKIGKVELAEMQDIVAETLGMKRGERGSERKHLDHKEYREYKKLEAEQVKELRAEHKKELQELKEQLAQEHAEKERTIAALKAQHADEIKVLKAKLAEQVHEQNVAEGKKTDSELEVTELVPLKNPLKLNEPPAVKTPPVAPKEYTITPAAVTGAQVAAAYDASKEKLGLTINFDTMARVINRTLERSNESNEQAMRQSAAQTKKYFEQAQSLFDSYAKLKKRVATMCAAIVDKTLPNVRSFCLGVVRYFGFRTEREAELMKQQRERQRELEQQLGLKPQQRSRSQERDTGMSR